MAAPSEIPEDAAVFNLPRLPGVLFDPDRACRDCDWLLFMPYDEQRYNARDFREVARLFCADCPIRAACRQHGIDAGEFGVWGGWFLNPIVHRYTNLLDEE